MPLCGLSIDLGKKKNRIILAVLFPQGITLGVTTMSTGVGRDAGESQACQTSFFKSSTHENIHRHLNTGSHPAQVPDSIQAAKESSDQKLLNIFLSCQHVDRTYTDLPMGADGERGRGRLTGVELLAPGAFCSLSGLVPSCGVPPVSAGLS